MQTLSYLPQSITLPSGEVLNRYAGHLTQAEVIKTCRKLKKKYRKVSVLAKNLRGKNDLHSKPYRPTTWLFTNLS